MLHRKSEKYMDNEQNCHCKRIDESRKQLKKYILYFNAYNFKRDYFIKQ